MNRENIFSSRPALGPRLFVEAILDESGEGVVKPWESASGVPPGPGQCNSRLAYGREIPPRFARGGVSVKAEARNLPAVIVRTAGENFSPRLGMGRGEIVTIGQLIDFFRGQTGQKRLSQLAQKRIAQSVDALEMLEQKNQPLEMRRFEFAVDAVKRMGHSVGDPLDCADNCCRSKMFSRAPPISRVLRFGDSPDQQMNLARVLGKYVVTCSLMNVRGRSAISRQPSMCRDR